MCHITANMFALYGNHIYITIQSEQYPTRNILDARSFVKRALEGRPGPFEWDGDTVGSVFVYHKDGD